MPKIAKGGDDPAQKDLLRPRDLTRLLGFSQSFLWRLRLEGRFPEPTTYLGNVPVWSRYDYEAWLRNLGREGSGDDQA